MREKIREFTGHSGAIYDLVLSDNQLFSASADKFVASWDVQTGEQNSFSIRCTHAPYSIEYLSNTDLLWIGLNNGDLHIIDVSNKKEIKFYQQHKSAIFSIKHLDKKKIVIVTDTDGNVSFWNSETLDLLLFLPLGCGKIRKISSNNDQSLIFFPCQDEKIRIFETTSFNEIITLAGHKGGCGALILNADEVQLWSGGKDGLIKIWDWQEEKLLHSFPAHYFAVYDLKLLSDNQTVCSVSRDKTIKFWKTHDFSFLEKIEFKNGGHRHSVNAILEGPAGLFTCSDDKRIIQWEK